MRKKRSQNVILIYGSGVLATFFVVILILLSPLFSVTSITIEGNYRITDESLRRYLGLAAPSAVNIFLYNSRAAVNSISNPYIQSVAIRKSYLNREIKIVANERRLAGFVEFSPGQYLFIDENGLVLEIATSFTEQLPIVVGLDFTSFTVGAPLQVVNERAFESLVAISRLLSRHEMESDVVRVDVNDSSNIRLFIHDLDISFGDTSNGDQKMRTLIEILNRIEGEGIQGVGTLDISDISRNSILRHLT
ncbi:MAG: FtsQ-type POTRA domain-containing protein [Defluviitaleaceae bacterium]|nr:FtsQ-type POTRA domain-containing protein [Defluviitaleaceae bacterium]